MRKLLIALVVVIVVAGAGLFWLLSDANRFKPQLTELIESNTGLKVAIGGNLSWRLWPPVQLVADDVSADWQANAAKPMLEARSLRLTANLMGLIGSDKKLVVEGVAVDGLRAHLVQTGEHANWMPPGEAGVVKPVPIPPPREAGATTPWQVNSIAIDDAVIDYSVDGKATGIDVDALYVSDLAPGKAFPLRAKLTVDNAGEKTPLTIEANVEVDNAVAHWQVRDLDVSGQYGAAKLPFSLHANAALDTDAGKLDVSDGRMKLADVSGTFDITAKDLAGTAHFSGHLNLPTQPLDSIATLLDTQITEPIGLTTAFDATEQRVDLSGLTLHYGDAVVTGKFGAMLEPRTHLKFDLHANEFTIPEDHPQTAMVGAGSFMGVAFGAPTATVDPSLDEPILPLELVRTTDWNGTAAVDKLHYRDAVFDNAKITTKNSAGNITATIDLPRFFKGSATTQLAVDAHTSTPQWHVTPKLDNVDSTALLAALDEKYDWVALFLANGDVTMHGNTPRELITSMTGKSSFNGGKGTLDIAEIKNAALAVANLLGGSELVAAWPDRLQYQRFTGTWNVDGAQQLFDVALDNLTLKAKGTVDPLTDMMDLTATVTVNNDPKYPTFKVGKALMGLPLPIRCHGPLDDPKCGADPEATKKLLQQALTGNNPEMKERLDSVIDEKVPEQYRDTARSLLDLLKQGAKTQPETQPEPQQP
jgi:AsmA protein